MSTPSLLWKKEMYVEFSLSVVKNFSTLFSPFPPLKALESRLSRTFLLEVSVVGTTLSLMVFSVTFPSDAV